MDGGEGGGKELKGKETGSTTAPMRDKEGCGRVRTRGVSDRVTLPAPLRRALQGSPGACSVK